MQPDHLDLTLSESDRRELILWAVSCAERLLPIFETERPDDLRLSEALTGALAFFRGELGSCASSRPTSARPCSIGSPWGWS